MKITRYAARAARTLSHAMPAFRKDLTCALRNARSERSMQLDNRMLADNRAAAIAHERQSEVKDDITRGGAWDVRWGFPGKESFDDSQSRRRPHPMGLKPSLVGYNGFDSSAHRA